MGFDSRIKKRDISVIKIRNLDIYDAAALVRNTGFYLTRSGAQLSIAVPFQVSMPAAEFVRVAERHIGLSSHSELDAIIAVAGLSDIKGLSLPRYARVLLEALLAESWSSRTL